MILVDQNHTNLNARICTTFKVSFGIEKSTMLPQLVAPVKTIHVMMILGYIFRTENLLYIPTSPT